MQESKKLNNLFKMLSYSSDGIMNIYIRDKKYSYINVPRNLYQRIDFLISKNNNSLVSKLLKNVQIYNN
jgi:hypothetical protein